MVKILCFRNSRLGDYLISIPSLNLLKKKYKNCEIHYLTDKGDFYSSLPKNLGKSRIVDNFIFFRNNIFSYIKLFFFLRSFKFDKFYYLQEKPNLYREIRDFIFFSLLNIKIKKGFFLNRLDYQLFNESFQITRRVDEKLKINDFQELSKISFTNLKPLFNFQYLTISIGGFSQPIIWKRNYWAILLKLILTKYDHKIIIIGTKKDARNARILSYINKKRIISTCGKTNLNQMFNIVQHSDLHITNDNGSMHVASLFEKKTVCLFNNHDPVGKWYPSNKKAIILRDRLGVNNIRPNKVFKIFLKLI